MGSNTIDNVHLIMRLVLVSSCGGIFISLSYNLCVAYFNKKVITTSEDEPIGGRLVQAPLFAVCAKDPFRKPLGEMFTLVEYMQNAVNVTEDIIEKSYLIKDRDPVRIFNV